MLEIKWGQIIDVAPSRRDAIRRKMHTQNADIPPKQQRLPDDEDDVAGFRRRVRLLGYILMAGSGVPHPVVIRSISQSTSPAGRIPVWAE